MIVHRLKNEWFNKDSFCLFRVRLIFNPWLKWIQRTAAIRFVILFWNYWTVLKVRVNNPIKKFLTKTLDRYENIHLVSRFKTSRWKILTSFSFFAKLPLMLLIMFSRKREFYYYYYIMFSGRERIGRVLLLLTRLCLGEEMLRRVILLLY